MIRILLMTMLLVSCAAPAVPVGVAALGASTTGAGGAVGVGGILAVEATVSSAIVGGLTYAHWSSEMHNDDTEEDDLLAPGVLPDGRTYWFDDDRNIVIEGPKQPLKTDDSSVAFGDLEVQATAATATALALYSSKIGEDRNCAQHFQGCMSAGVATFMRWQTCDVCQSVCNAVGGWPAGVHGTVAPNVIEYDCAYWGW